ncbi:hypothetical protein [Nocardia anaemiae]|uniref:hypothetical protein n=1 Tax=Nocardia anaemiae TaxID=263910 RepID=UPI0007A43B6E|nr:hypothetical protein [Nocardia anaemiae]
MGEQREEPQSARGAPGSRDTGTDTAAGGQVERKPGHLGHEETTSAPGGDADKQTEFTTEPPPDTESATPPYEGRKASANAPGETATGKVDDAEVDGATAPTEGGG